MKDKFDILKPVGAYKPDPDKPPPKVAGRAIAGIAMELIFKERVFFYLILFSSLSLIAIYGIFLILFQLGNDTIEFSFQFYKLISQVSSAENFILLFVFFQLTWFSIIFFNTALTYCAITFFKGEKPAVYKSIQFSLSRLNMIIPWALISGTIGFILRILRHKVKDLKIILPMTLLAGGWAITTFLVIPIIVVENISLKEAIKRSGDLFKDTWGERLHAHIGIVVTGFLTFIFLMIPVFILQNKQIIPLSITFGFTAIAAGIITSFTAGAGEIVRAGVYQYAIGGPMWFERKAIKDLFTATKPEKDSEKDDG